MNRHAMFLLPWIVILPSDANAEDISEFVNRTDAIGVINIYSGSQSPKGEIANGCGVAYTAYVREDIKNMEEGALVSFRAYGELTLSGSYLVFLVDGVDSKADASSPLSGIRSERCAESGITLTSMVIGEGDRSDLGPVAIMQLRKRPGGKHEDYHMGADYFFGSTSFERLIDALPDGRPQCLEPIFVDIELPQIIVSGVLYPADSLVEVLRQVANK